MFVCSDLIFIILIIILIFFLYYYFKYYHRTVILSKQFIGPSALPIIGNALLLINRTAEDILPIFLNLTEKYGNRFKLWLGTEFNVYTFDVNDIENVLTNSKFNEKSTQYKVLQPWLREGLLLSDKQKWFQRRKIITPAFHFKILEQFVEIFDHQSYIFIKNLSKYENEKQFDLLPLINLYTLDVICETAMGVKINAQIHSNSEYVNAVKSIADITHQRILNAFYKYDFIFKFSPLAKEQMKFLKTLHEFSEKVIITRREEILKNQNNIEITEKNKTLTKRKLAFLDILLQSTINDEPLSNLDIREEVDTFMFEGHDTTTSAIHFMLYFLACHPEVQNKCYEEICKVFGNENDKIIPLTYQKLHDLQYMELCIKETLRLCPPVPLIGRNITTECTINGNVYPAGTNIGISTFSLGRAEYLYSNPNEFIPERFYDLLNTDKKNSFAYIPFSAGPRNCIGQKFALLEIKSIVSKILHYYELEYVGNPEGPIFTFQLILRCSNTLWFKLKSRSKINQ